jgi:hypothetical protein
LRNADSSAALAWTAPAGAKGYFARICRAPAQKEPPRSFSFPAPKFGSPPSTLVIGASSSACTAPPTPPWSTLNFCASCCTATFASAALACAACAAASACSSGAVVVCSSAARSPTSALMYGVLPSVMSLPEGFAGTTCATGWKAAAMDESTAVFCAATASIMSSGDPLLPSEASRRAPSRMFAAGMTRPAFTYERQWRR